MSAPVSYSVELPAALLDDIREQVKAEVLEELRAELSEREWATVRDAAVIFAMPAKRLYAKKPPGVVTWDGRVLVHVPTLRAHLLGQPAQTSPKEER